MSSVSDCAKSVSLPIPQGECDSTYGKDFQYSALQSELVVGEIYVRVYNEQPTFVLEVSGRG